MRKKIFISLIFTLILVSSVFAKSITVACLQNGKVDEQCKAVTHEFEDTVFELLFDSGFIVTGIPIEEIDSIEKYDIDSILGKLEEPTDYILIAYLEYDKKLKFNKKLDKKIPQWEKLTVKFIRTDKKKQLLKKNINLKNEKEIDPIKKAKKISNKMTNEIVSILQRKGA